MILKISFIFYLIFEPNKKEGNMVSSVTEKHLVLHGISLKVSKGQVSEDDFNRKNKNRT